ncbi:TetR family transcriptional regulator [Biostraticola tofi]|uniref:TetR family transcriptional regulator n=1 Tax=Biostraticola tofi TaxID=466109 RepID=A0A4R3YZ04_9GAMM|nr:TetR family transcriptional regulator [Biostraticola tofi]TCV96613.1 TetR family transcriptional regulator [Biostraticola tofi]
MAYLNREDRHAAIVQAAMRVEMHEGIAATTVRRVASEAGIATGQVHHHFASVGQLRAEAFVTLVKASLGQFAARHHALAAEDQLMRVLGYPQDEQGKRETRLWNEAVLLAERDECIRSAFALCMSEWHQATVRVIEAGRSNGEFNAGDSAEDIAWRLIGLVCGLDGITQFESLRVTENEILRHVAAAARSELL